MGDNKRIAKQAIKLISFCCRRASDECYLSFQHLSFISAYIRSLSCRCWGVSEASRRFVRTSASGCVAFTFWPACVTAARKGGDHIRKFHVHGESLCYVTAEQRRERCPLYSEAAFVHPIPIVDIVILTKWLFKLGYDAIKGLKAWNTREQIH